VGRLGRAAAPLGRSRGRRQGDAEDAPREPVPPRLLVCACEAPAAWMEPACRRVVVQLCPIRARRQEYGGWVGGGSGEDRDGVGVGREGGDKKDVWAQLLG
jgi:hypothetical protein